jgi:hypothetical protein
MVGVVAEHIGLERLAIANVELDGLLRREVVAQRGTPLQKLSANKSNVSDEQLRVMEPVLAVAVGLSLEEA